ncbi:transposase [Streptomyces sp. NPDC001817]|uniref:transposase n=1 Tax=Streptomyces sp. NPDC001817 TaxID=3154398 RepID=UPI003328BB21
MTVLSELRNRGMKDVCIVARDDLKGLPDAVTATWSKATAQTCVSHLFRTPLRLASERHHATVIPALNAVNTALTEPALQTSRRRSWPASPGGRAHVAGRVERVHVGLPVMSALKQPRAPAARLLLTTGPGS